MTQGIFVGHHDRTGAALCITKNGVVRGKSWTRQTLSDAWDATNWDGFCGTPWEMVAPELKLAKKVTADKEGAGPPLPRIVVESLSREDSTFRLLALRLTDTVEVVWVVLRLHRMEERLNHMMTHAENESELSMR